MSPKTFSELELLDPVLRAVLEQGYLSPTPIQARAIPPLLEGRDLLGIAQTGTGKTAAFALPILDALARRRRPLRPRRPPVLVLTPTRELASQVGESFRSYGRHVGMRATVVFGGVAQRPQARALEAGVHALVATPGRLLDLMGQGLVDPGSVGVFVLDEADRMLDMGFLPAVRKIVAALPRDRQTVLFSATMPEDVVALARSLLREPLRVEASPPASTVEQIVQSVFHVEKKDKRDLLAAVLRDSTKKRVLVFSRTRHGADRIVKHLRRLGERAEAIHGDKSQGARERALAGFRSGRVRTLVATDIAARGLDVPDITHVVNFDLPNVPESYVHRIGRTARAGRDGIAISFCAPDERGHLQAIERTIRREIPVATMPAAGRAGDVPEPARGSGASASARSARGGAARRSARRGSPGGARRGSRGAAASR